MWTLLKMLLVFADAAPAFRVGELVCASYPSDTVYPKTHNASAPKNPRVLPPGRKRFISVNPSGTLRYYALIKMRPLLPSRLRICLVGCHGLLLGCLEFTPLSRLPFIPDTISDGRVRGPVERGRPRHPRLFQSWSIARIHGVGALHVPVVMPVGVGVSPVFDFDRGPGLPPKMLWRLQSRLSFSGNRERQGQALLRALWWFHHSARKKKLKIHFELIN